MTVSAAFRTAWKTYAKQFGAMMKFLVVELCIFLITLTPLLFLTGGSLSYLALLIVPLFVFLLIPARQNAAFAMQHALDGGSVFSLRPVDFSGYGGKLGHGLKRLLFLLLWSAPVIACAVIAKEHISGEMDVFSLMKAVSSIGNLEFMGGFLDRLGWVVPAISSVDAMIRGVVYLAGLVIISILVFTVGCGMHSGARHAYALGNTKLVNGHHGKNLLCWICSLVVFVPLLICIVIAVTRYTSLLSDITGILFGSVELPDTKVTLIILGIGVLITLPLLPFRSMVTAAYVHGLDQARKN